VCSVHAGHVITLDIKSGNLLLSIRDVESDIELEVDKPVQEVDAAAEGDGLPSITRYKSQPLPLPSNLDAYPITMKLTDFGVGEKSNLFIIYSKKNNNIFQLIGLIIIFSKSFNQLLFVHLRSLSVLHGMKVPIYGMLHVWCERASCSRLITPNPPPSDSSMNLLLASSCLDRGLT